MRKCHLTSCDTSRREKEQQPSPEPEFSMRGFPRGALGCGATWTGEALDLFRAGLEREEAEGELRRLRQTSALR